jgi:hypothetical protein
VADLKRAVLFSGGVNRFLDKKRYHNNLALFYRLLLDRCQLNKEELRVYLSDGLALTLDGTTESSLPATREQLLKGLSWLAEAREDDMVFLVVSNHGDERGISTWGGSPRITPRDIELALKNCAATKVLFFGQCYSGAFGNLALSKAIILCACGSAEPSYPIPTPKTIEPAYDEFFYQFIGALVGQYPGGEALGAPRLATPVSLSEAYRYALKNDRTGTTPLLFDSSGLSSRLYLFE